MKSAEEIVNILEAYDLTGSFRDAGEIADCSHHTVARYVRAREEGRLIPRAAIPRDSVIDGYVEKIEEIVSNSRGKIRADVVHDRITAMGFTGSERTTRRAVAKAKAAWRSGRHRVHRPWIAEPGMWAQYDLGDGPVIAGAATVLFCLWLGWCRFRVVIPLLDKIQSSVWAACDAAFRKLGGIPAYLLADDETSVTVERAAGIPVGDLGAVEFGRHYGLTVATCVPYDPAAKGGSDSTVKIAKADLVPTDANLLTEYGSLAELEAACAAFCAMVNAQEDRITRRAPAEMLAEERARLHPVPAAPFTAMLGVTWRADMMSLVTLEGGRNSVPHERAGQIGPDGAAEDARHRETTPGGPQLEDAPGPEVLTARQLEVLCLIARGYSNRRIGYELHISANTVSLHVSHILASLKVTNRTEAAARLRNPAFRS